MFLSLVALLASPTTSIGPPTSQVLKTDVAIIGGGAGGAHAALRLKDMGQSIVLIEQEDILVSPTSVPILSHGRRLTTSLLGWQCGQLHAPRL